MNYCGPDGINNDLWLESVHEAAHVIGGRFFGHPLMFVRHRFTRFEHGAEGLGLSDLKFAEFLVRVVIAGEATNLLCGTSSGDEGDRDEAAKALTARGAAATQAASMLLKARSDGRVIARRYAPCIKAVAVLLAKGKPLSQSEVDAAANAADEEFARIVKVRSVGGGKSIMGYKYV